MKRIAKTVLIGVAIFFGAATLAHLVAVLTEPVPTIEDFLNGKTNSLDGYDAGL